MAAILEDLLDREVDAYVVRLDKMAEVRALLDGTIDRDIYIRFLKSFYTIEMLSQNIVNKACSLTAESNSYLSERFELCAKGEFGHAKIARTDLEKLDIHELNVESLNCVKEYESFLEGGVMENPLTILGHSYLFENTSAILFPRYQRLEFPSRFVRVHAIEDPKHAKAIKETVRNIEASLNRQEVNRIIAFTRESGDHFLNVFNELDAL